MSNEPIFQKLAREYAMRGKSYERMVTPYLSPVKPLGTKQTLTDTPVYGPNEYLDGPYKAPLPKRNFAQLIKLPETDPEFARRIQEFVTTAPLQILQGTPAGSFIKSMETVRTEDGGLALEAEVAVPKGFQGATPKLEMVEVANKYEGVVLKKTITVEELIDGRTSADIIQELGQEFAEKHPTAAVSEVNVGETLDGDMVVTVRGTLISEEDNTSITNPEQTDESVNAASNEENDEDDEPVFVAPNFWKIRDEE